MLHPQILIIIIIIIILCEKGRNMVNNDDAISRP